MLKIAYACSWWRPAATTWSGSAAGLMDGLQARSDVALVRVDAQHPAPVAASLKAFGQLRGYGNWKFARPYRRLTDAKVRRRVSGVELDAVIGVGDVETVGDQPTFLYQDANFSVLRGHADLIEARAHEHVRFPGERLDELVEEQRRAYAAAAGVLAFSQWFADWLVENDGVPREKVHVVGGGLSKLPGKRDLEVRGATGHRVLFIGRDFFRKGGDLVVGAIAQLREGGVDDFTLTVIGPTAWPMPGEVPSWVNFLGEVPAADVAQLWSEHDIFALPTWYEPYGLVFLEARAAGLPILGRAAFCMPELVPDSVGRLISPEGEAAEVAEQLAAMSQDAELFANAAAEADVVRTEWTWDGVAARVVRAIESSVTDLL